MTMTKEVLKGQGGTQNRLGEIIGKSYVITRNYCNNNA